MSKTTPILARLSTACVLLCVTLPLRAEDLRVTIENLQPADGFYFTPVWLGFHDGGFDLFDDGSAASAELEAIAELGDTSPLSAVFASVNNGDGSGRVDAVVASPAGFPGLPLFDPGESMTQIVSVSDPSSNRYLTYGSMVVPSNDAFIGNDNAMAYAVFNEDGSFAGPLTIDIVGGQLYDAGTEVNDRMGAAFSTLGGTDSVEGSVVGVHPGLDNFLGTDTAAGTTIAAGLEDMTPLARIHVEAVPEPSTLVLTVVGLVSLMGRVSRRRG
jgi:hypothetical protein